MKMFGTASQRTTLPSWPPGQTGAASRFQGSMSKGLLQGIALPRQDASGLEDSRITQGQAHSLRSRKQVLPTDFTPPLNAREFTCLRSYPGPLPDRKPERRRACAWNRGKSTSKL